MFTRESFLIFRVDRFASDSKLASLRTSGLTVEFAANDEPNRNVDAISPSFDGELKNQSGLPAPQFVVSTKVRGQTRYIANFAIQGTEWEFSRSIYLAPNSGEVVKV